MPVARASITREVTDLLVFIVIIIQCKTQ